MVKKVLRLIEKSLKHDLVLEVLIRHIGHGGFDVENIVDGLMDHTPELAVSLDDRSTFFHRAPILYKCEVANLLVLVPMVFSHCL